MRQSTTRGRRRHRPPALRAAIAAALALWGSGTLTAFATYPNDPFFATGEQWALTGATASINAPLGWCVSKGAGVLVATIDSGAEFSHPDLAGKLVAGANFTSGRGDPNSPDGTGPAAVADQIGHGTETAGVIAAATNNGRGIAAVAPDAQVLVMKVLTASASPDARGNPTGTAHPADLDAAIRWSVAHGARVVNISIGGAGSMSQAETQAFVNAVHAASSAGVGVVIAAGNNGETITDYRLVAGDALIVAGLGPTGEVAYYSNPTNAGTNIYAPGGDENQLGGPSDSVHNQVVTTAVGGIYRSAEGTSIAAPVASGAMALLISHGMTGPQARQRLIDSAVSRNGVPELDVSRALGVYQACTAPPPKPTAPHSAAPGAPVTPPTPTPSTDASPSATPKPSPAYSPSPSPFAGPSAAPRSAQGGPLVHILAGSLAAVGMLFVGIAIVQRRATPG